MKFTMELRYSKQTRLLFLAMLGSTFVSLAYLIFVYNPLQVIIAKVISFYPGSIAFELFKQPPYEIIAKAYIYNVTNPEEFMSGEEKLRVNDIGPYVYKETLFNINTTFNENGSLTFVPRRLLEFMPEFSVGDPSMDSVLAPNIPLLGITAALHDSSIVNNLAVTSASAILGSKPFVNVTINDYLHGYDDPLVTLANNVVPNWIDFGRFGILDRMMALDNGSDIVTINLNYQNKKNNGPITESDNTQIFSIERWNGSPGLREWGYMTSEEAEEVSENSICNTVEGAFMGTMFPPNMQKNTSFRLYRHAFCRPLPIYYKGIQLSKDGFEGYLFTGSDDFLATPEKNPDNACYCRNTDCLLNGIGDMSPCYYGIPITMSQPHFLNADPILLEQVEGLSPDKEKHSLSMLIHPEMGLPLEAKLRLQINIKMPNTQYNSKVTPFNNLVIPLFWVELNVETLPTQIKFYITLLYHILPVVQQVLMYTFAVLGVAMIFGTALATVLHIFNGRHRNHMGLRVSYSEIPVFPLKTKLLKPEVRIDK